METGRHPDDEARLAEDPVVGRLVPDPANPPELRVVTGWVGRSATPGCWRLYLVPTLREYLEFRDDDVVHHEPLRSDARFAPTALWLRAGASVNHVTIEASAVEGEFLQGELTRAFAAPGVGGRVGPGRPVLAVNTWNCTNQTAGTCTLVLCTRVDECRISREANPCV